MRRPLARSLVLGRRRAWTPTALGSSLTLWLDAADAQTITLNGATVVQWSDKSGTGNHMSNATASSQPLYQATGFNNLPALSFDNTDDFLGNSSPVGLSSAGDFFYAAAFQMRAGTGTWRMVMGGRGSFNSGSTGGMPLMQRILGNDQIGIHNTDIAATTVKVDVTSISVPRIATIGRTGGSAGGNGGTVTVTATGPSQASYLTTGNQTWVSGVNSVFQIGGKQTAATSFLDGVIAKCIAMNRNATQAEREQIEGWLAWECGMADSLPAGHPYKSRRP